MLYVFLGGKLISCDTIVPICMEIATVKPKSKFVFFCESESQLQCIKENETLYSAIQKIGRLKLLGSTNENMRSDLIRKLLILLTIFTVVSRLIFKRSYCFHFRKLNNFPYSIIKKMCGSRVVLFESNGRTEAKWISEIYNRPIHDHNVNEKYIVGFTTSWLSRIKGSNPHQTFKIPPSFLQSSWKQHLDLEFKALQEKNHWVTKLNQEKPVAFIILGTLGRLQIMRETGSMRRCLRLTIQALLKTNKETVIILKPHIITDETILNEILKEFEQADIRISNIHPGLLAKFSTVVICNAFSTALVDAHENGAVTLEFTDYTLEALKKTNNKSMEPKYVDHFINHDYPLLMNVLAKLFSSKATPKRHIHSFEQEKNDLLSFIGKLN